MPGEHPVGAGKDHAPYAGTPRRLHHVVGRVNIVAHSGVPGGARSWVAGEMQDSIDAGETACPVIAEVGEVGRFDLVIAASVAIEQGQGPAESLPVVAYAGAECACGAGDQDMWHGHLARSALTEMTAQLARTAPIANFLCC